MRTPIEKGIRNENEYRPIIVRRLALRCAGRAARGRDLPLSLPWLPGDLAVVAVARRQGVVLGNTAVPLGLARRVPRPPRRVRDPAVGAVVEYLADADAGARARDVRLRPRRVVRPRDAGGAADSQRAAARRDVEDGRVPLRAAVVPTDHRRAGRLSLQLGPRLVLRRAHALPAINLRAVAGVRHHDGYADTGTDPRHLGLRPVRHDPLHPTDPLHRVPTELHLAPLAAGDLELESEGDPRIGFPVAGRPASQQLTSVRHRYFRPGGPNVLQIDSLGT